MFLQVAVKEFPTFCPITAPFPIPLSSEVYKPVLAQVHTESVTHFKPSVLAVTVH